MKQDLTLPAFVPVRPDVLLKPARTTGTRLAFAMGSLLGIVGLVISVPSVWLLLQPDDALFRPDIYGLAATPSLIFAVVCVFVSHRIISKAQLGWAANTYEALSVLRRSAWRHGIWFDVEVVDSFPRVLISRSQGVIGLAGHDAGTLARSSIIGVALEDISWPGLMTRRQRVISLKLEPSLGCGKIFITAGDGLMPPSHSRLETLFDRLSNFLDQMSQNTGSPPDLQAGPIPPVARNDNASSAA
jgi:hypothetical protein